MDNKITYFDETLLSDNILDALYDMHFDVCTPIQAACIDTIIEGNDILGVAQTGTGKTAAYLQQVLPGGRIYDKKIRRNGARTLNLPEPRENHGR